MPHRQILGRIREFQSRRREKERISSSAELARVQVRRAEEQRAADVRVRIQSEREQLQRARSTARTPSRTLAIGKTIARLGGKAIAGTARGVGSTAGVAGRAAGKEVQRERQRQAMSPAQRLLPLTIPRRRAPRLRAVRKRVRRRRARRRPEESFSPIAPIGNFF